MTLYMDSDIIEWITGDIIMDEKGDRLPEFWLLDVGIEEVFTEVLHMEYIIRQGRIVGVSFYCKSQSKI